MPISLLLCAALLGFAQQSAVQAPAATPADDDRDIGGIGSWSCPQTDAFHGHSRAQSWFEGTLGTRHARLYLDHAEKTARGALYTTDNWEAISFAGPWSPTEVFTLGVLEDAATLPSTKDGLTGQLRGEALLGTWKKDATSPAVPLDLHRIPEPGCYWAGPWKSFSDERWPIKFSYPADWHLVVDKEKLTLTCPADSSMIYEGADLYITQSTQMSSSLAQCGGRWMFETDDCKGLKETSAFRSKAVVRTQQGVTSFTGWNMEYRRYCKVGGYVGQGEGESEVLHVGSTWMEVFANQHDEILHRLNASIKKRR